jgi:hypothetical protein
MFGRQERYFMNLVDYGHIIPGPWSKWEDDFYGTSLDTRWSTTVTGAGSVVILPSFPNGILQLNTGGTVDGDARLHTGTVKSFHVYNIEEVSLMWMARLAIVANFDNYAMFGLANADFDPSALPTLMAHMLFYVDSTGALKFTSRGTSQTSLDLEETLTLGQYYDFMFLASKDAVGIYLDGQLLKSKTDQIPTGAFYSYPLEPYFGVNTVDANTDRMHLDYVSIPQLRRSS